MREIFAGDQYSGPCWLTTTFPQDMRVIEAWPGLAEVSLGTPRKDARHRRVDLAEARAWLKRHGFSGDLVAPGSSYKLLISRRKLRRKLMLRGLTAELHRREESHELPATRPTAVYVPGPLLGLEEIVIRPAGVHHKADDPQGLSVAKAGREELRLVSPSALAMERLAELLASRSGNVPRSQPAQVDLFAALESPEGVPSGRHR